MKKIQNIFWLLVPVVLIGYLIYKIALNSFTDHFLGANPVYIKAIIIDEKNFIGNQPIRGGFTYSYQFEINKKKFIGDSHDESVRVGDSVEIEYNKEHPSINKPIHPKD